MHPAAFHSNLQHPGCSCAASSCMVAHSPLRGHLESASWQQTNGISVLQHTLCLQYILVLGDVE